MRPRLGLDRWGYSPATLERMMILVSETTSFEAAARVLALLNEHTISARHLATLVEHIGGELAEERHAACDEYRSRDLTAAPTPAQPPIPLAAVLVDGGRMQCRATETTVGVHDPHWRETKVGLLVRMTHTAPEGDPHPELPRAFQADDHSTEEASEAGSSHQASDPHWPPEPLVRTCLATLDDSESFGWQLAAEAERRGFLSAERGVFLGDGQAYNWTIHKRHFGRFTPVLDFVHAVEHLHQTASVASELTGDVSLASRWVRDCWQGRISEILGEIDALRQRLGEPADDASETDPARVLWSQHTYFQNNRSRMDYPCYRRAGLPVTSAPVESLIKQLNRRVKSSEKFWGRTAGPILELKAASLCQDDRLLKHLRHRRGSPYARQPAPKPLAV